MRFPIYISVFFACWGLLNGIKSFAQGPAAEVTEKRFSRVFPGFSVEQNTILPGQIPLSWNPSTVAWTAKLDGYGQSAPLIWENRVYVTTTIGGRKEKYKLRCIELISGKAVWDADFESSFPSESTPMVSRASPTPICDGEAIYVFFESGDLVAVDFDGKEKWQRSLQKDFGLFENKFGLSSTPAQTQDAIYLLLDHKGDSSVVAIDKTSGSDKWVTARGNRVHSWSSPGLVKVNGEPVLICSSAGSIDAYKCESGELLCTNTEVGGNSVATPYDLGGGRFLVSSLIRPADGPSEGAVRSNLMARLVREGNQYRINIEWIAEDARGSFSSPIEHQGCCYWTNPQGVLFCLDSKTGKQHYSKRLPCGACWATPFGIGDRIYFFGKEGETVVVKAGTTFEQLSQGNFAWDRDANNAKVEATPAASRSSGPSIYAGIAVEGAMLIRRGDELYRMNASQ